MFSRYKKPGGTPQNAAPAAAPAKAEPAAQLSRKPVAAAKPMQAAKAVPADKEKKRKERLGEIKVELHKRLLDNLNLAALETASAQDLRQEIVAISAEALEELSVVLNKDERATLHQ